MTPAQTPASPDRHPAFAAAEGTRSRRAIILVLDGVGCGEAPDTEAYGDAGSDTIGNVSRAVNGLALPHLERLGLGNIAPIVGVSPRQDATGAWGHMLPQSAGKDSTTGHWEIAGVQLARPFPTYPHGFPADVIEAFSRATGRPVIANTVASGTAVISDYAEEQRRTGAWIVYTSADSVFQIAAHEGWIPLDELYRACEIARAMLVAPHDVSRVIARPFTGEDGSWARTANRRDYSLLPTGVTLLDALAQAGIPRTGVGKVDDLFAGRSISARHTTDNRDGISAILDWFRAPVRGFCFANLVDFDQLYGHRNDVRGFQAALESFDEALPALLESLEEHDLLFITADHGNDPTTPSTDHARERVPLLVAGRSVRTVNLGGRATFADLGATVAHWFGLEWRGAGTSFLGELGLR